MPRTIQTTQPSKMIARIARSARRLIRPHGAILALIMVAGCTATAPAGNGVPPIGFNAEMAYLQDLNREAPAANPQIAVLLMLEYQNGGRAADGSDFFADLLKRHEGAMTPAQELVYLSALGILRAEAAGDVPLLQRVGWINDTIDILERARDIGANNVFFSRFATALVYARLPGIFDKQDQALEDLKWLSKNSDRAFQPGQMRLIRETYAEVLRDAGREGEAETILAAANIEPNSTGLVTNFAVNPRQGATFRPPKFVEIVPDQVFLISGLDFTEHYFILSADRRELIAIDAGVTPDGMRAALDMVRARVPDLPLLTTVFITHAHWDHVGGHGYFRELNPNVTFYGRENYAEELAIMEAGPADPVTWFFGNGFDNAQVQGYRPDVKVATPRTVTIGGTRFELIPAPVAETPDAMFIHMPDQKLLFVGDFIMPFVGAPFIEEGSIDGLIESIDLIQRLAPEQLWHGHEPLTTNWPRPERLATLKPHLVWLRDEVGGRIRAGTARDAIHRENLIPPTLFDDPQSQVFFLAMREQIINRMYDQAVGYWGPELEGLDHLGAPDYGAALNRYFDLDIDEIADAVEDMLDAGDLYLAERVVRWALAANPPTPRLKELQRRAALRLRQKFQAYNPFKFILYSQLANEPLPQLPGEAVPHVH